MDLEILVVGHWCSKVKGFMYRPRWWELVWKLEMVLFM